MSFFFSLPVLNVLNKNLDSQNHSNVVRIVCIVSGSVGLVPFFAFSYSANRVG